MAYPNPADFEPDDTLFSMIAVHHKLYAIEPNQGLLLEINADSKSCCTPGGGSGTRRICARADRDVARHLPLGERDDNLLGVKTR